MGDPLQHSQASVKQFGGTVDDYLHIHTLMDSSKLFLADWRHRALLHNTFGIHIFEQLIGASFKRKSDGADVCTRSVVTQHIIEDLGAVPTPGEFLRAMPISRWMAGISSTAKKIMQQLTIDGDNNREAYIKATVTWRSFKYDPPTEENYYIVSFTENTKVGYLKFKPGAGWSSSDAKINYSTIDYWADLPLTPFEV